MNWTSNELAERIAGNPSLKLKSQTSLATATEKRGEAPTQQIDATPTKKSKYRNIKTEVDGIVFDSKKEAARYQELKARRHAGEIRGLERQVKYKLILGDETIGSYVADFTYEEREHWSERGYEDRSAFRWHKVVEDVKSEMTRKLPVYRLKKKLMKAIHGIEIREV